MSVLVAVLRWAARLSSLLVAGGYLLLVAGEFSERHSAPPSTFVAWAGIALLTATCVGMLAAWRWELAGAAGSLASLAAFTSLVRMGKHGVLVALATPGILFLADWLIRRPGQAKASPTH